MKHLKKFENWTTNVTGNYDINYGDKPQLSDVVIETIDFIENNLDKIKEDILNDNRPYLISFKSGLKYSSISLKEDNNIPFLLFRNNENYLNYSIDITNEEYEYLKEYFLKIYKKIRKIINDKDKEEFMNKIIQKDLKKYNI